MLPFGLPPSTHSEDDPNNNALDLLQLKGLRAQTDSLSRSAVGTAAAAEPPLVLGSTVGLLSPIELPALSFDEPAKPPSSQSKDQDDTQAASDADAQKQCFAACFEGRREAHHKLVRKKVLCEMARARAMASMSSSGSGTHQPLADASASTVEENDIEISRIDQALAALPPLPPPAAAPPGIDPADAAALGGAGAPSTREPPPPSPVEVEALLRRRMLLRTRLAPLHTYLGGISNAHTTHTRQLLHEAAWCAPALILPEVAAGLSPLPAAPTTDAALAARLAAATHAVIGPPAGAALGASGGAGGSSPPRMTRPAVLVPGGMGGGGMGGGGMGGGGMVGEPMLSEAPSVITQSDLTSCMPYQFGVSSMTNVETEGGGGGHAGAPTWTLPRLPPISLADFEAMHAAQSDACSYELSGPSSARLAAAAAAAADADGRTAEAGAARALAVARARLALAQRRVDELSMTAATCTLVVGDDVLVDTEQRGAGNDYSPPRILAHEIVNWWLL